MDPELNFFSSGGENHAYQHQTLQPPESQTINLGSEKTVQSLSQQGLGMTLQENSSPSIESTHEVLNSKSNSFKEKQES